MRALLALVFGIAAAGCGGGSTPVADPGGSTPPAPAADEPADPVVAAEPAGEPVADGAPVADDEPSPPPDPEASPPVPLDLAVKLTEPGDHGNTVVIDLRPDPERKGGFVWIESLTDQAGDMTGLKELRRRPVEAEELVALWQAVDGGFYDLDARYGDAKAATPQTLLVTVNGKVKRVTVAGTRNTVFGAVRDALRALAPR